MKVPLLNFEGGPGVPLLSFERGPKVPLLNFTGGGSWVPLLNFEEESWVPRSRVLGSWSHFYTMPFSMKDFFSKCNQIRRKLWIWSHLLKKSLMENFIFCAVLIFS